MKTERITQPAAIIAGSVLTLPTAYFILISILKFELDSPYLYDAAEPFLERVGISESIGFNINLLILFGPVLAVLLNLLPLLDLQIQSWKDRITFHISVKTRFWNLMFIAVAGLIMLFVTGYGLAENCTC